MPETYAEVEKRITQAVNAIHTREKVSRNKIAKEFRVPVQRLRSRLNGHQPMSEVRGVHGRKLAPDQEKALHDYFILLDKIGLPARLNMIEQAANALLRLSAGPESPDRPPPKVGPQWAKRWLKRQNDLFKVKRKPIPAARKNAHDAEMLMEYFKTYKAVVDEFGIQPGDQWNFDETGYRMGMGRADWVISSVDASRRIYSKCPDNRESLTAMECINGDGGDIPPFLILSAIQQLAPWYNNDLDGDIATTVSETGFTNDWISLMWVKHFEKFSAKKKQGVWRLLLMDGHGSHHTYEFLKYCEEHRIKVLGMPPHTTHLLQPLDVGVFQPLKHWHAEAVNEAVQNGDETFTKVEFLNAFNTFRRKAFKESTIRSAWKHTGLIPYNPGLVVDKIREAASPQAPRATSALLLPSSDWLPLDKTPATTKDMRESMFNQLANGPTMSEGFRKTWSKFAKGACQAVQRAELLETKLNSTAAAEKARKARQKQSGKVLQTGGILYAKDARRMVRDRLELEEKRENEREEAREKRYKVALQKCYKQTKKWRSTEIDRKKRDNKRWMLVMKELLKSTPMYVE